MKEVWLNIIINLIIFLKAITTMITVGFGDIIPQNNSERLFAVFSMLVACVVFAYSMNTMG